MKKAICTACGGDRYETRKIEYLYTHHGKYLLVPDTPVKICTNCGTIYYDATVLKKIEQRFFAIQDQTEKPDCYIEIPSMAYR